MEILKSNRIFEERKVTTVTTNALKAFFEFTEPRVWLASEHGDRYYVWMPQGTYHLVATDSDYIYYKATDGIKLGSNRLSTANNMPQAGGIFFNRHAGAKYPSGAFVDFSPNSELEKRVALREGLWA